MRARAAAVVLLAAALLAACTGTDAPVANTAATTTTTTPAPTPHTPTPATGLLALRPGDVDAAHPADYQVVILNAWEAHRIAAIKASSPSTTVLVYKDLSSTRSYASGDNLIPTGVDYGDADRHHPDWFLTDQRNRRVEWKGYGGHWWMDVGNPAYQQAWIANVVNELARNHWDGVYVDNAMYTPRFYLPAHRQLAKYPDDHAYSQATEAMLANAARATQLAGKQFVPNFGARFPDTNRYERWVALGTGAAREHFARFGTDGKGKVLTGDDWAHELAQQETAQRLGKTYYAITYADTSDTAFQQYARASFLIGWDGRADSALFFTPAGPHIDPWTPTWTKAIGTPTSDRQPAGPSGSAWRRTFTNGVVMVNPSATSTEVVDGIVLSPGTGRVLDTPPDN